MGLQVIRIEREAEEVTVFYRPNSLSVEELSRNPVANSLAVTFLLSTETVRPKKLLAAILTSDVIASLG